MKSSVLIVGHPEPEKILFGADFIDSPNNIDLESAKYPVIAIKLAALENNFSFLKELKNLNPQTQLIVATEMTDATALANLSQTYQNHFFLTDFASPSFEQVIQSALERHRSIEQEDTYSNFTKNLNSRLKNLSAELSDELKKREKKLIRSQKRVQNLNTQIECLQNSLTAVHAAESIIEIETLLFAALTELLGLSWVRIFIYDGDHLDDQLERVRGQALFKESLQLDSRSLGKIVFARKTSRVFKKNEEELLQQIAESVALAIDRLSKLDQAENLKLQWESTFDAISEPLCLTDEKFHIIKTNKTFLTTSGQKLSQLIGQNCFSAFCDVKNPGDIAPSSHSILLQRAKFDKNDPQYFEVTTQRIRVNRNQQSILLVMFRDVTEQKRIEKHIFESAKMAELGTIGSSIAHDINNPLGGMLSFLQLIKMDLNSSDILYEDILSMEKAGHRCKDIVENLLSFSRKHDSSDSELLSLKEVIHQSLKVTELQTRSLGVAVNVQLPPDDAKIVGHFNLLSQALGHILQNAFDAVSEKLLTEPGYNGQVKVVLHKNDDGFELTITDNGIGISPELQNKILNPLFSTKSKNRYQGLGLTLAYQIIDAHSGQLDIFSRPNVGTTVKISFRDV